MHWAIQVDLHEPEAMDGLLATLDGRNIPWTPVHLDADNKPACKEWLTGEVFAYGSQGSCAMGKRLEW